MQPDELEFGTADQQGGDWVTRVSAKGHFSPDLPFPTGAEWWLGEGRGNAREMARASSWELQGETNAVTKGERNMEMSI